MKLIAPLARRRTARAADPTARRRDGQRGILGCPRWPDQPRDGIGALIDAGSGIAEVVRGLEVPRVGRAKHDLKLWGWGAHVEVVLPGSVAPNPVSVVVIRTEPPHAPGMVLVEGIALDPHAGPNPVSVVAIRIEP